jgi:D-glycero-alpha-D-manno-heptose-7-phosphate kinase
MSSSSHFPSSQTRRVTSRAPTRIDLGGGWTDVPPYCEREGGFVCNVAIDRYATATISERSATDHATDSPLARAALKRAGVTAAVELRSDFPVGAGLGGSSAASAALFRALGEWRGLEWARAEIAELGRQAEVEDLGVAGGRQDHYAAAFGGALGLTFTSDTAVRPLRMPEATRTELVDRSILIYTGESRISGETITAVLGAYERGDRAVTRALARMKALAREMADSLERGDVDAVGEAMGEHWAHQRSLHHGIPTPRIDEIIARARANGAVGAKAMGASGGGCVLVIGRGDRMEPLRAELRGLGEIMPFGLDAGGATVLRGADA